MKIFALHSTSEEQKENQAFQLRLYQLFAIIFLTTGAVVLAFDAIFGKTSSNRIQDMMYIPSIIILIGLAPNVMKYSWKLLLPRTIITTTIVAAVILGLNQLW